MKNIKQFLVKYGLLSLVIILAAAAITEGVYINKLYKNAKIQNNYIVRLMKGDLPVYIGTDKKQIPVIPAIANELIRLQTALDALTPKPKK